MCGQTTRQTTPEVEVTEVEVTPEVEVTRQKDRVSDVMKDRIVKYARASVKDEKGGPVFERLKKLFTKRVKNPETSQRGTITRTCRICGKTFTLPENVQHWPDCCQECRAKYRPVENITRKCRKCGRTFTFPSNAPRWPKYCPECQKKRKTVQMNKKR